MGISKTFEGVRFSIKVPLDTLDVLERIAESTGSAREQVVRDWLENWKTLAGLSPSFYERLVFAAKKRRLTLEAIVNDALSDYCSRLPPVPEGETVETPISLPESEEPKSNAKKKKSSN